MIREVEFRDGHATLETRYRRPPQRGESVRLDRGWYHVVSVDRWGSPSGGHRVVARVRPRGGEPCPGDR